MEWTPGTKKQLKIIGRSWIEYILIVEEIKGTFADLNSLYDVTNYAIKDKKMLDIQCCGQAVLTYLT